MVLDVNDESNLRMSKEDQIKPKKNAVPRGEGLTPEQKVLQEAKKLTLTTDGRAVHLAWTNLNNLEMEAMLLKALDKIRR